MATKWKNFTRSSWVKAAAWILSLAMAGLMAWQAVAFAIYAESNDISVLDGSMLSNKEISDTYLAQELYYPAWNLLDQASYGNEDSIQNGDTIDTDILYDNIYNEFFNCFYNDSIDEEFLSNEEAQHLRTLYPAEEDSTNYLTDEMIDEIITALRRNDDPYLDSGDAANFRSWMGYNRGVYQYCRQTLINENLMQFHYMTQNSTDYAAKYDYYVYCKKTDTTLSNISESDAQKMSRKGSGYRMVCSISDYRLSFLSNTVDPDVLSALENEYNFNFSDYDSSGYTNGDIVYIALKPSVLQDMQKQWTANRRQLLMLVGIECTGAIVILLCVIILCFGAGRKPDDDKKYLVGYDRIWAEILYCLYFCILAGWCTAIVESGDHWIYLQDSLKYGLICGITVLFAVSSLLLLLSQVRRIKAKQWLNGWICWRLFHKYIIHGIVWLARQFRKTPLRRKIILLAVLVPLACAIWPLIPFIIAGLLYFGIRQANRFETVTNGAADIRAGKTDTKIKLTGGGPEINGLADNLNQISEGLQEAVTTAVKSERLKSELISNVSHDIKTPLTSIITYIDLLKKCDIQDRTAQEYIAVLDQKSQRLRALTADLFDASKATSGAMKLNLAQTDFDALLRQALGERSEHIEKAGLDIRILSQAPTYVNADGKLLWRILDNLISNCTRYALPNSRVYITLQPQGEFVNLTMKNISATELNISADELMQRFTRGDRSRHTEGSGLGLSIAQSLAELMGGSCHVEIDGDLFKAVVSIPKWIDIAPNTK
ncbi:MAG: HAMP domain-containing histidine kinase [Clostridia bacterium]|nr:HAMP domain-containing histidine kinase [Clostridia bacterium]